MRLLFRLDVLYGFSHIGCSFVYDAGKARLPTSGFEASHGGQGSSFRLSLNLDGSLFNLVYLTEA